MRNDTLKALIAHHGNAQLRATGWPLTVHVCARATHLKPDALVLYGRLSAAQVLALLPRLCESETEEHTAKLLAVAQRLAGTEAELYLAAKFDRPEPRTGALRNPQQ